MAPSGNNIIGDQLAHHSPLIVLASVIFIPFSNGYQAYSDINQVFDDEKQIRKEFDKLPSALKASFRIEASIHLIKMGLSVTSAISMAMEIHKLATAAEASKNVVELSNTMLGSQLISGCPFLAILGIVSLTTNIVKSVREQRVEELQIQDYELVIDNLKKEISESYQEIDPYLGESYSSQEKEALQKTLNNNHLKLLNNEMTIQSFLDSLEEKSLNQLIYEQAYANIHNVKGLNHQKDFVNKHFSNNQTVLIGQYYQSAIDKKVREASEKMNSVQHNQLQHLVVAKQHEATLEVATPLLKKLNNRHLHMILLTTVITALAICAIVGTMGAASPTVGIALSLAIATSKYTLDSINQRHVATPRDAIKKKINQGLKSGETFNIDEHGFNLSPKYLSQDEFNQIEVKLKQLINMRQDKLSEPLQALLRTDAYSDTDNSYQKIVLIKQFIKDKQSISKSKELNALRYKKHAFFNFLDKLDFESPGSAMKSIDEGITKMHNQGRLRQLRDAHKNNRNRFLSQTNHVSAALENEDLDLSQAPRPDRGSRFNFQSA